MSAYNSNPPPKVNNNRPPQSSNSAAVNSETNHVDQNAAGQQPKVTPIPPINLNSAYATMQPVKPSVTQEKPNLGGLPSLNNAANGVMAPKVPPLNFNSTFNLKDAPLLRPQDMAAQNSQERSMKDNQNGLQGGEYLNTNAQQMLTTEFDAMKRPPVTVKQTDIIFLPDKGLPDAILAFDVSRKQANLPPIQPDFGPIQSGASSARGGSSERRSSSQTIEKNNSSLPGSSSYRGTDTRLPAGVSHHYKDLGDLMILSRQEASSTHRMHIRDNLKARSPLGCPDFQYEMNRGVFAINVSPDGHSVAIMTRDFGILVHDKVKEKTYSVAKIDAEYFGNRIIDYDKFMIYVSNELSHIYVVSESQRVVATWTKTYEGDTPIPSRLDSHNYPQRQSNNPTQTPDIRNNPQPPKKPSLARSNSASKALDKPSLPQNQKHTNINNNNETPRSRSRLRDFFRGNSSARKQESSIESPEKVSKNQITSGQQRSQSQNRSSLDAAQRIMRGQTNNGAIGQRPEQMQGHWTNITLHSMNRQDMVLTPLATANTTQYNLSNTQESTFSNGLPMRLGRGKKVNILGEFQEEGSLIAVKMYDYAAFVQTFQTELYSDLTGEVGPQEFKQNAKKTWTNLLDLDKMDQDTRKVLVLSQQFVEQDKVFKGNVWYQNPFYLIEKIVLATEIEYMGILNDNNQKTTDSQNCRPTLISKCDNQGNLLAIAVNSVHKIYCQILFVSLKNRFVSVMKLFEFVSAEDNPPFDTKGKTNLQVDDIAWTRNDAFLILMFNTGALAVLPRLGSQLLKIYNPTIINVHYKDAANFTQYRVPRGFNELIPKNEIINKVKKYKKVGNLQQTGQLTQNNSSNGYRLVMHPSEEAFIVYSGTIAYIMQLELEPEIDQLFEQENKNYYFMRFCFSMKSLSRDQETLQKIPQLLTSKLPICEFDKNQEKLDNNDETDVAKRIQTASQINPWQMDNKRMDTIQSFGDDFDEESEKVLLNFKHLLFAYRWNAATTLNYLEWLITITNDIFFYYLKHSEPMYAYHALKISEYYMTRVLQKPQNINQYKMLDTKHTDLLKNLQQKIFDYESKDRRPGEEKQKSFKLLQSMFQGLQERMMNPVIEIYTNGIDSKTLQDEVSENTEIGREIKAKSCDIQETLKHLLAEPKTLAEKIQKKNDFVNQLPLLVAEGDGNTGFSFQKNYTLLAYYCLIQFRNYQASNFNILFLILASYIVKNHVNDSFMVGLQKFTLTLLENFIQTEKTDEMDLFFGKCGRNVIVEAPLMLQQVQKWVELVAPRQTTFSHKVLNPKTIYEIQSINYAAKLKQERQTLQQHQNNSSKPPNQQDLGDNLWKNHNSEKVKPVVKQMVNLISALQSLNYQDAIQSLRQISATFVASMDQAHLISPTQAMGVGVTFFANSIYYMAQAGGRPCKSLSMTLALEQFARQSIKMDKKSPINTVSQHIKIYDAAFVFSKRPSDIVKARQQLMEQLGIKNQDYFKKFASMLMCYSGDYQRAAFLLKPSLNQKANIDLLIFNILLQSTALKSHSKNFLHLRDVLQDYSMKNIRDFQSLHQTTERLNAMHVVKFTMAEVSCTMQRIMSYGQNSLYYREYLWACFSMLPLGVAIIFKEQVCRDTISNIKSILAFQIRAEQSTYESFPLQLVVDEFPLAKSFFEKTLEGNCEHLEYILPTQAIMRRRFFQQVELILICLYDQHQDVVIFETTDSLANKIIQRKQNPTQEPQTTTDMVSDRVLGLICGNFRKFGKIFSYLKIRTDMRAMDCQVKLYKQTNPAKAIESQIMICCKSLQHMVHFPKYTNVQAHLKRALSLLTHLLFHTQSLINFEVKKKILLPVINMVQYNKLNRQNKQMLSGILDLCKAHKNKAQDDFDPFVKALEGVIYDRAGPISSSINTGGSSQPRKGKNGIKQESESNNEQMRAFKNMIEEVMNWMFRTVLPTLDYKKLNHKGHRRCIQAKKDLFELASIMQSKLDLPMTNCSLFYRGVNFEVKHENSFGISDDDLKEYTKLRESDKQDAADQTILMQKSKSDKEASSSTQVQNLLLSNETQEEDEMAMNKTRVEKLADISVINDMKDQQPFPALDLDILCMGNHQLFDHPDLPQNIELGDMSIISGVATLNREREYIEQDKLQREHKKKMLADKIEKEEQEKKEMKANQNNSEASQKHKRSLSKPQAFVDQINLQELSEQQETKESEQQSSSKEPDHTNTSTSTEPAMQQYQPHSTTKDTDPKSQQPTSHLPSASSATTKPRYSTLMGRIKAKAKPVNQENATLQAATPLQHTTKITLRKNSARRRIMPIPADTDVKKKDQQHKTPFGLERNKQGSAGKPPGGALPPRARLPPKGIISNHGQAPQGKTPSVVLGEVDGAIATTETDKKSQKFQPFNLVFLKKKKKEDPTMQQQQQINDEKMGDENDKAKQQFKVKMPLKIISKNLAKKSAAQSQKIHVTEAKMPGQQHEEDMVRQSETIQESADSQQQQRGRSKKIKPFQVQLIKVNKKGKTNNGDQMNHQNDEKDAASSSKKFTLVRNLQEKVTNLENSDKTKAMRQLMDQLDQIQENADTLKQNMSQANVATNQMNEKNNNIRENQD